MGNEGSLPTDEDIEGFEYQARSPPSAYPPGVSPQAYAGANANDPRLQQPTRTNGMAQNVAQSVAGRIKGNPFKRGNNAHNQNSFGIEKDMGQTTLSSYPTPSEMQGDNLAYSMGQASVGVGGQPYPTHPQQYPQQHHQQQQIYAQQQYQQQQQQYYHTPGQPPLQQQPPQQQFPQIGRNTRPGQRAGAAILNGMRNLNISSTMNRIGGAVGSGMASPGPIQQKLQQLNQRRKQQQQQQQVQNVNEWETRWDEDSDEEDEDEQPDIQQPTQTQQQQQQLPIAGADALPTTAMTPPIGPPELDSGFSGAAAALVSPEPQLQQQQQPEQPPAIFQQQQQPLPGAAVAVTPGPPSKPEIPDSAVTDDEVETTANDDGVEWDTGQSTTPNVEQFMPLLRVLGKGSFGKVRTLLSFFHSKTQLSNYGILTHSYFYYRLSWYKSVSAEKRVPYLQ